MSLNGLNNNQSRLLFEMQAMVGEFVPSDKLRWRWVRNRNGDVELRVVYRTPILGWTYNILFQFPQGYPSLPPRVVIVQPRISDPQHNCREAFSHQRNCVGCQHKRIHPGNGLTCVMNKIPHLYSDGSLCAFNAAGWNPAKHTAMWALKHAFEWILFFETWLHSMGAKPRQQVASAARPTQENPPQDERHEGFLKSVWRRMWT